LQKSLFLTNPLPTRAFSISDFKDNGKDEDIYVAEKNVLQHRVYHIAWLVSFWNIAELIFRVRNRLPKSTQRAIHKHVGGNAIETLLNNNNHLF
jgi:hypothetical protein